MGEQPALLRLPERPLEGIRLVACDMDGTALNENKEFSAATLAAFDALQRRGVRVTIVSARTPFMLGVFCRQAGIGDTPVIAMDGAEIVSDTQQPLYGCPLEAAEAARICDKCHRSGVDYTIYTTKNCYLRRDTRRMWRFELYDRTAAAHGAPPVPTAVYEETTPERIAAESVYKVFIDNPDDMQRAELEAFLSGFEDVRIDCSEGRSMSVTRREASKRSALLLLAERLGLKREEVCCFGDAENDLSMLRAAGLGVAMGNATAEARAAADVVVADNDHDGCAEAIRRFLLGGEGA